MIIELVDEYFNHIVFNLKCNRVGFMKVIYRFDKFRLLQIMLLLLKDIMTCVNFKHKFF